MKYWVMFCMVWFAFQCPAGEIVVLTDTPVAEFTLPDGSVLENAYVWRRSSQGLMVMHDGGNYFLNFKLLPDDWKAAYLGTSVDVAQSTGPEVKEEPFHDKYKAEAILGKVPELDVAARRMLLRENLPEEMDQRILMLGVLQSLLLNERDEARRFLLFIVEIQY